MMSVQLVQKKETKKKQNQETEGNKTVGNIFPPMLWNF